METETMTTFLMDNGTSNYETFTITVSPGSAISQQTTAVGNTRSGYLPCGGTLNVSYILTLVISVFIILCNALIIIVTPFSTVKKQFKIFVIYLAISDALTGIIQVLSILIQAYRCMIWKYLCKIHYVLLATIYGNSFFGIFTMSLYSFIFVRRFNYFDRILSPRRCKIILACGAIFWLTVFILGIALPYRKGFKEEYICIFGASGFMQQWYANFILIADWTSIISIIVLQMITTILLRKKRLCLVAPSSDEIELSQCGNSSSVVDKDPYSMTKALKSVQKGSTNTTISKIDESHFLKVPSLNDQQKPSSPELPKNKNKTIGLHRATDKPPTDSGVYAGPSGSGSTFSKKSFGSRCAENDGIDKVEKSPCEVQLAQSPIVVSFTPAPVTSQMQYKILTKYARMTSLVVIFLVVLWVPYLIMVYVMTVCKDKCALESLVRFVQLLAVLPVANSVVNIFIYVMRNDEFRFAFYSLFCLCIIPHQDQGIY